MSFRCALIRNDFDIRCLIRSTDNFFFIAISYNWSRNKYRTGKKTKYSDLLTINCSRWLCLTVSVGYASETGCLCDIPISDVTDQYKSYF